MVFASVTSNQFSNSQSPKDCMHESYRNPVELHAVEPQLPALYSHFQISLHSCTSASPSLAAAPPAPGLLGRLPLPVSSLALSSSIFQSSCRRSRIAEIAGHPSSSPPSSSRRRPPPHSPLQPYLHHTESKAQGMDSMQSQNTSLQRLQNVEKRIIRVLELAGGVMEELANPAGPRKDLLNIHCGEFMKLIKDIQVTLREEIKSACEYRPFEKCDYGPRLANEVCCKKLEYVLSQLDSMKQTVDEYHGRQVQ